MRHISESIIGKRGSGFFNSKSDLRQGDIVYLRHDKSIPYMYISDQGIISALFLGSSNYKYERRDGIFVYAYDNEYGIRVYYLSEYNDNLDDVAFRGKCDVISVWRGNPNIGPTTNMMGLLDTANLKKLIKRYNKIWERK